MLVRKGYTFYSETDTEVSEPSSRAAARPFLPRACGEPVAGEQVLVKLIADVKKSGGLSLEEATRQALSQVDSTHAAAIINSLAAPPFLQRCTSRSLSAGALGSAL